MDSPIVQATTQSTLLGAFSNVLGQLIACWQSGSPYNIELRDLLIFAAFNILSCPPNYLWQTWLEARFPGYTQSFTSQEKEKLVDKTVVGHSTATNAEKENTSTLRSRNEAQAFINSDSASPPSPQQAKKQLNIRNTVIKFLLDQTIGAAVNTTLFIMGIAMLRGQSWQYGWEETKAGFWPLVFAGQKLWPLVSIISLTLVPVERRMVFGSIIGIGWNIFLTLMVGAKKHGKVE